MDFNSFFKKFQENEWLYESSIIVMASLFMGLILALKVEWPIVSIEAIDFFWMFLLSLLMFFIFIGAQKLVAFYLDCKTKTKLISFRRYLFRALSEHGKAELPFEFPAWLILPLLLALINFKWLAIFNFDVEPKPSHVRRRWSNITESDVGKIAIAGPFAIIVLGIIFKIFAANNIAFLCMWFSFLALIPICMGFKLLNSTRVLWFFAFVFSVALLLLINLTSAFAIIVMAVILAAFATIVYYVLYER